ncbi:MAG TPA: tol-pal system protein YbgF [Stellaceae bacterium]|nr:tol-pal system protein YbgF [Stellaceae bacterium]
MRFTAFAVILSGMLCLSAGGVHAQNNDIRPLLDRLDRLERDMNLLQRQVYRSDGPTAAPSPTDVPSAVNYEVRISQLEDQMRTITGQIEEVHYNLDQMKRRLDTLTNDIDQRLAALEHPGAAAATGPVALQGGASPRGAGANPAESASAKGTLGQIATGTPPAAPTAPPAAATAPADLPTGSPQDQYNYAFGLLRQANYPAAEQALRAFIQRYPNDSLAGNAQYWLGETYYVRKDYNNAAAVFAEGYQKYPKGGKAADNLLKLGMALGQLGQKTDACRALARLDHDFPTAPVTFKDRVGDEKKMIGCER